MTTFKDQICEATDVLRMTRRAFATGSASYDDCKAAAIVVLTLRQTIEKIKLGKARTKINPVAIAALLR